MKLLVLTLVLLLCSSQVLTLRCYACADEKDQVCATEMDCPNGSKYCVTVENDGAISSRTCEASCPGGPYTSCCQDDLC